MNSIKIGDKIIGSEYPCLIVAEMSGNHNQSYKKAVEIIHAAKECGADAIKLQTYTPDTITLKCDADYFRIHEGPWMGQTLYELYEKAYTPWEWHPKLKEEAEKLGLIFFSTPFDITAVDFLEKMDVPVYKIASFELVDIPLIEYVAKKGKPVIISIGMATLGEIDEAVKTVIEAGNDRIIILKCVSAYPADPRDANLKTIVNLSDTFGVCSGISDHTLGYEVAVAGVSLGASLIEKHLTISRSEGGPDSDFSMEPGEFKIMVNAVRLAEKAIGSVHFGPTKKEMSNRIFRRSLFIVNDVNKGDAVTRDNVRSIRPSSGLHPRHYNEILGMKFNKNVLAGTPMNWDLISLKSE